MTGEPAVREFEHFPNLVTMFFTRAAAKGDAPFLWAKKDGAWVSTSWREAAEKVAALATALRRIGLNRGDTVMLVSENRPEWCIADLAIMAAGCITVPAYITNTERDHQHILDDSGARAVIVSTQKLAKALLPAAIRTQGCEHVIGIDHLRAGQASNVRFHDWNDLIACEAASVQACAAAAADFTRQDLACIIYTSGTGGAPRGVMQHHGAILHNVEGCIDVIANDFSWDDEVFLSFLPASHAYEHSGGQMFPIGLGAEIYYSEGLEKLASNIEEVRPTLMIVVPRLFEVLRQRILKAFEKQGKLTNYLMSRALDIGAKQATGSLALRDRPMDFILGRTLRPKVACALRGPDQGDGLGRGAAQPGGRHLLPVGRPHPPPGLRPNRGGAGDQLQPAPRRRADGYGRSAAQELPR
jgi:long-chain acyl-CoA synthetase